MTHAIGIRTERDPRIEVVAQFGRYGETVEPAAGPMYLQSRDVLWLVTAGEVDIFAVDARRPGRWHFLARLEAGAIITGAVRGAGHLLLCRPLPGCGLRRIRFAEIVQAQRDEWFAQRPAHGPAPQERALCDGLDLGLQGLRPPADAVAPSQFVALPPGHEIALPAGGCARPVSGVVWIEVRSGRLSHAAETDGSEDAGTWVLLGGGDWISCQEPTVVAVWRTADLLVEGVLAQHLRDQQERFLRALDRRIRHLNHAHEQRMLDRWRAGESIREKADHRLRAVMERPGSTGDNDDWGGGGVDTALAAARLVADAAGITIADSVPASTVDSRLSPVERIAARSHFRVRTVRLEGVWWRRNVGPLYGHLAIKAASGHGVPVALLWWRGGYHVVDPASGQRHRVSAALTAGIRPEAAMFYRPLPDRPVSGRRLLAFGLRGSGADASSLVLAGLAAVALGTAVPVATGKILGSYVPNAQRDLITQTCVALLLGAVAAAAFMLLRSVAVLRMEGRFDATVQTAVWDRLLRLPAAFFSGRSTGELASAALGVSAIRRAVSGVSSTMVQSTLVAVVNIALLLYYSPLIALAAVSFATVSALAFLGLGVRQLRWRRERVELQNKLNDRAFQTLRGLSKLRVAGAEPFAYAHWAREFAHGRGLDRRTGRAQNLVTVLNVGYIPMSALAMFLLFAGPARGTLSASDFITINVSVNLLIVAMTQATNALTSLGAVLPLYQQLKPILQELPEVRLTAVQPGELSGEIEVSRVSFRYADDGPLILHDVSFHIAPGEFVAVVGESGCGKSTLLRLLIGFEQPTTGSVRYSGQDLSSVDQVAVRRQCGVVLQNAQPLTGTIFDCICGVERFTLAEAWQAAEMAGLAADITELPMGMHTLVSDGGGTLSGGQRQRLIIAQALIRKPRILFFDEATSALDNATQRIVAESTQKLRATRVVIAHRLSTIMAADRVIVMAAGRVVEQGAPAELYADSRGVFHRLVRGQTVQSEDPR